MNQLDHDRCYTIIKSRDARFDGRFFTGVKTTGIYCRPVCPARTPRADNVEFFMCAAAAEAAGFRPCLRCRPESSPGTLEWMGTSGTVARALQFIAEGYLDHKSVDQLAEQVNVGARQLRRLFVRHLGASPVAFAQTRRVHFAKKLIDETTLSMAEIAFAAGFNSIRRFNASMRAAYGKAPTELRTVNPREESPLLEMKLYYRPPLDWRWLLSSLQTNSDIYCRTVQVGAERGEINVQHMPQQHYLRLTVPANLSRGLVQIVEYTRRLFDLNADLVTIHEHLRRDPLLKPLIEANPGVRVPGQWGKLSNPDAFPFDYLQNRAETWRPWRAYAAMYLLRSETDVHLYTS